MLNIKYTNELYIILCDNTILSGGNYYVEIIKNKYKQYYIKNLYLQFMDFYVLDWRWYYD